MAAVVLGYNNEEKKKITDNRDIFDKGLFYEHDLTMFYSIFLDYYGDVEVLENEDVLDLVEEFANVETDELYKLVNNQGEEIVNIVEEILVNYS